MLKVKFISLPYIFQVLYVLCFTRPRYQASVYRTIGPLVFSLYSVLQPLYGIKIFVQLMLLLNLFYMQKQFLQ